MFSSSIPFSLEEAQHTHVVDSSLIADRFIYNGFDYCSRNSTYYSKPLYKTLWKKISTSEYKSIRSSWIDSISTSQARSLLKYTQLEMDF